MSNTINKVRSGPPFVLSAQRSTSEYDGKGVRLYKFGYSDGSSKEAYVFSHTRPGDFSHIENPAKSIANVLKQTNGNLENIPAKLRGVFERNLQELRWVWSQSSARHIYEAQQEFKTKYNLHLPNGDEIKETDASDANLSYNVIIKEEITYFEHTIIDILRQGALSEAEQATAEDRIRSVIKSILEDRGAGQQLSVAPSLWKDRDKANSQQPHEFIQATYFDAGHTIDRTLLRKLDRTLLLSLERQERDPDKAPPQAFQDRFPRKGQQLDAEIAQIKETGERPESWREQHRLRQAARRRGTNLGKE